MTDEASAAKRIPYEPPVLAQAGSVAELTMGTAGGAITEGVSSTP